RLKSFKPVFRVTSEEERQALEDFLFDHSGVKAFLWRPPKHNRTIRIVCREWSVTDYACYTDFNCTFEQVVI
ncbi:phage tail protein, partial [Salmonella enterica subsp. enterica serovar Derby]|nr:phage tail protein [Salmonella enterica subsp. enterica serovar Derby]